jgi:hypothetical protein
MKTKRTLATILAMVIASVITRAQTGLITQEKVTVDACADRDPNNIDASSAATCAQDNMAVGTNNWRAVIKWASVCAEHGDDVCAFWVATAYEDDAHDKVMTFAWYDIAAALKAAMVKGEGPCSGVICDDNAQAINYRNSVAKKMTSQQVQAAVAKSRRWISAHPQALSHAQESGAAKNE